MTNSTFWRLAWKEYRQQRELLVAIGVITLGLLALALGWSWLENQELSTDIAYHIALMMPVFYVLGCAAMLFAGEHERDTFAFLRALPVRSREVFWPKALVVVGSTLLLTAALTLVVALLTRFRPLKTPADVGLLVHYFLIMAEVLVWTMLFSQLLKHPFWAIAAGGVAYLASWVVIAVSGSLVVQALDVKTVGVDFNVFIVVRCVLAVVLAVVNVALGMKWLERDRIFSTALAGPAVEEISPTHGPATQRTMLGRLWWQSLRESGWIFAAIYGVLALLSVLMYLDKGPIAFVWGCLPALVGSFAFFQDHWRQHYRFFSEQGVAPRTLWWARILASVSVCLPWLLIVAVAAVTEQGKYSQAGINEWFQWPGDLLVLAVVCFAWGQWCSLVFRSGMVGLFIGVAMSVVLVFVVAILRALGIPDWLGIYLPTAALLWASWYRAPDWLAERNSWRRWFAYAATLAVPLLVWLGGIAAHRAYEIPQLVDNSSFVSGPGVGNVNIPAGIAAQHSAALAELQRPATAEELETAQLYRDLWNELRHMPPPSTAAASAMMGSAASGPPGSVPSPEGGEAGAAEMSSASAPGEPAPVDKKFEARLGELVERFVQISQRPDADFFPAPFVERYAPTVEGSNDGVFSRAAIADARRLDDAQEHDQALERLLALIRHARHYQQRGDEWRIFTAVQSLRHADEQLLGRAVRIKQSKESLLELIKTLEAPPYNFTPDYDLAFMREYVWHRGLVEFNPQAWDILAAWPQAKTQQRLLAWLPWERTRAARWVDYQAVVDQFEQSTRVQASHWRRNTLGEWGMLRDSRDAIDPGLQRQRAAMRLRLLLLAYKAEHNELPPSLDELEKAYPGQVPKDPFTQQPWLYRPQGIQGDVDGDLQQPHLWSPRFSRFGGNSTRTGTDLTQPGDVFVIEPGETVE